MTSSLAYLRFPIFQIPMDREKGGQRPFFSICNEVETPLIYVWYDISWSNNLFNTKWGSQCGVLDFLVILT